jgi:hypothetical protein
VSARPERPVFLVGCPRSGTTLLQRILDAHPQAAIAPETHFVRTFLRDRSYRAAPRDPAVFARLVEAVVAMPAFAEMRLDAASFRAAASAGADRDADALFRLLLAQFRARTGAQVVGEKTPNHLLYMRRIERAFAREGGALFVHIVRDPRAVVHSWRSMPWSTGSVAGDAAVWAKYQRHARTRRPAELLTVRYEDLVAEPERVLHGVCTFVGLPFDAALLRHHERVDDATGTPRPPSTVPWQDGARRAIAADAADRWRGALQDADVRAVDTICWFEMRRHGYRPVHDGAGAFAAAALATVKSTLRRKKLLP